MRVCCGVLQFARESRYPACDRRRGHWSPLTEGLHVTSNTSATIEHPKAQTVFILSIVGIFVGICAPIAWYMGVQTKKEIAAQPGQWSTEGNLKTGTLIGKIFTILYIVVIVLWIIIMIATFALAGAVAVHS